MWTAFSSICGLVSPIEAFFTLARTSVRVIYERFLMQQKFHENMFSDSDTLQKGAK
jgi:hypothetical protein